MSQAENILFFDAIFSILLVTFGASVGATNFNAFQTIQSPTLAPLPQGKTQTCQNTDAGCIAQNLALATAYVGWAIVNLPIILVFLFVIFVQFGNAVLSVAFSPQFGANGVPFLGLVFSGLQLFVIWEVIRTIRGVGGIVGGTI